MLELHGSRTDWASVILSGESYRRFQGSYPLLSNQLDLNLRVHPLLFVGCSMQDPRVLDWLRPMPDAERRRLCSPAINSAHVPVPLISPSRMPTARRCKRSRTR